MDYGIASYFDGYAFHHIATYFHHLRIKEQEKRQLADYRRYSPRLTPVN